MDRLRKKLADTHSGSDDRKVRLERVGITGLVYPLSVREKEGGVQLVTAQVCLLVGVHRKQRAAHLSNLVETLHKYRQRALSLQEVVDFAQQLRKQQDRRDHTYQTANVRIGFKFFVSKAAPVSRRRGLVSYDCGFDVSLGMKSKKSVIVTVPVSLVCPCSLEISDIGAHNQRAHVSVQLWQTLEDTRSLHFEDIIALVEESASSGVYSVLKRLDEKDVTDGMFRNPRFTEDVVREAVVRLRARIPGVRYRVWCESIESIHGHNVYAEASGRLLNQMPVGKG